GRRTEAFSTRVFLSLSGFQKLSTRSRGCGIVDDRPSTALSSCRTCTCVAPATVERGVESRPAAPPAPHSPPVPQLSTPSPQRVHMRFPPRRDGPSPASPGLGTPSRPAGEGGASQGAG